jgi:hypothetical protein
MKMLMTALAVSCLGLVAAPRAEAAVISVNTLYSIGFGGAGSAVFGTAGTGFTDCINPNCTPSPAGTSFEFTLTEPGELVIQDLFMSIDRFELFDSVLGSLGFTSAPVDGGSCGSDFTCAAGDPAYSRGIFSLAPGSYSITGVQTGGVDGAGALIVNTVPVPASLPLLFGALGGLAFMRRRKKSA